MATERDNLWAEALDLYQQGVEPRLPDKLKRAARDAAVAAFVVVSVCISLYLYSFITWLSRLRKRCPSCRHIKKLQGVVSGEAIFIAELETKTVTFKGQKSRRTGADA